MATTSRVRIGLLLLAMLVHRPASAAISVRYSDTAATALSAPARSAIEQIAAQAEREARALLPDLPGDIALRIDTGTSVIPETGETGAAPGPGALTWTVDITRKEGAEAIARSHLRATLLHELHHLARGWLISGGTPRASFMDAVVAEGLATAFARDVTMSKPLWGEYPVHVADWVRELQALTAGQAWPRYRDWMIQHPDGRRWIGYRAGTHLADRAIKASGKSAAELAGVPVSEILRLAGY